MWHMDTISAQRSGLLKRNLREQLVDMLGGDIVRGRLQPGELLPSEDVLLARYRVSRTVLREALNVLSGKGLLDARPKRGTMVRPRSEWSQLDPMVLAWRGSDGSAPRSKSLERSLDHLMELRRIIEPEAAALAAARGTAKDFARISSACAAMETAGSDVQAFVDADLAFHVACLEAAHNDFMLPIAHAIRAELVSSMRVTNRDADENRQTVLPLHHSIRDAIVARDAAAARLAMQRHLDDTERRRSPAGRRSAPRHMAAGKSGE
jgi:GntR family transcriptional regulator, galactonate operon transcriptional repressor